MYVRVQNGVVVRYPYTKVDLKFEEKNTSFPREISDADAAEFGVFPVAVAAEPSFNPITHALSRRTPTLVNGQWEQGWDVTPHADSAQRLVDARAQFILQVDSDVDDLYRAAIGNRGPEYADAERDAAAYIAAGYTGTVPAGVQSWATAKGWTATQAADDIMQAAAQLNGAKQAIRAARLLRKEQARTATAATLPTVTAQWNGFVAAVRAQLGL